MYAFTVHVKPRLIQRLWSYQHMSYRKVCIPWKDPKTYQKFKNLNCLYWNFMIEVLWRSNCRPLFRATINQRTGIQHQPYILYKALLKQVIHIVFKACLRRYANDSFSAKVKAANLPLGLISIIYHLTSNHFWKLRLYDDRLSDWHKVTSTNLFDPNNSLFYWLIV